MQVGTSCASPVSRGTDYAFILHRDPRGSDVEARIARCRSGSCRANLNDRLATIHREVLPAFHDLQIDREEIDSRAACLIATGNIPKCGSTSSDKGRSSCFPISPCCHSDQAESNHSRSSMDIFAQHLAAVSVLADRDAGSDLPSSLQSISGGDGHREAALSVEVRRRCRTEDREHSLAKSPRIALAVDLPLATVGLEVTALCASLSDQSLRGHTMLSRGLPTALPASMRRRVSPL